MNFNYRIHDPRVGRFFTIDPLSDKYPWNSPYVFSENDVIRAIELEGCERKIINYYYNLPENSNKPIFIKSESHKIEQNWLEKFIFGDYVLLAFHVTNSSGETYTEYAKFGIKGTGNVLNQAVKRATRTQEQKEKEEIGIAIGTVIIANTLDAAGSAAVHFGTKESSLKTPIVEKSPKISTIKSREIIIDENISPKIAEKLKDSGYSVKVFDKGTLDEDIIKYAKENNGIVITNNIKDFKKQGINTMKVSEIQKKVEKVDEVVNAVKSADKKYGSGEIPSNISLPELANKK